MFSCTPPSEFILKKRTALVSEGPYIRVLLKAAGNRILISSKSRMRITEINSGKIKYDGGGRDLFFYPEKVDSPVLVESIGSAISVDGTPYRGMVEVHNSLGKISIINILKMNEYLYGVVPSEIPSLWPAEALKAQAVAARSYTYHHLMSRKKSQYDLDATTSFQVYRGISAETQNTNAAVEETSGYIMVYNNKPIIAFFHSTCGGRTMDDKYVWSGEDMPYLQSVKCGYCGDSPNYQWDEKISLYEIRHNMNNKYKGTGQITGISLKRQGPRVETVSIQHKNGVLTLSGNEFRLLFPENKIKSMYFTSAKTADGIIIHGNGWGHGVGMCQWGAKGMAESGADYKSILAHYYKGISIVNTDRQNYASR
jgi:stage II sporulation protein D